MRLRLVGGRVSAKALGSLVEVAEQFGDGRVHVTSRANLQVRALPGRKGQLDDAVLAAIEKTGLLPTRTHELVRNVMVSPQSGLADGRADLRRVATDLDRLLCTDPELSCLPGRFLFVFDDGRGDLIERACDLGLVALDAEVGQLRVGAGWGAVIPLGAAASHLAGLAAEFVRTRGTEPTAPWHLVELPHPLTPPREAEMRLPAPAPPLPYGEVRGGRHVAVPAPGLDREDLEDLCATADELIVTPWRGVLIPKKAQHKETSHKETRHD